MEMKTMKEGIQLVLPVVEDLQELSAALHVEFPTAS
jgi:hypothetical protein